MATPQYRLDFDNKLPPAAQDAIRQGMEQADHNADPVWKHVYAGCVLAAARKFPTITVDNVLDELESINDRRFAKGLPLVATHNLSAIGPAMVHAAEFGIISGTQSFVRSRRKVKRGNLHRLWHSNFYEGRAQ